MVLKHFKLEEFGCHCGCKENKIDLAFVKKLDDLREVFGKTMIISSGYRCPKHNTDVSHTGATGPHTTGHAADILISRFDALTLLWKALDMNTFTGFGLNQKGGARYIHLDDLPNAPNQPRPTLWTY
jgi:uncharacterized protein YcbK (DUF882 family)